MNLTDSGSLPFYYFSNGLYFASEIEFPELNRRIGKSLIYIRKGKINNQLNKVILIGNGYQLSETEFLLNVKSVAKYLITSNHSVIIEPYPSASLSEIRLYFLNLVLAVLLHRNKKFLLHASCITNNRNEAFLIAADSGIGKSTLALSLYQKGYSVLNDDISSIHCSKNGTHKVYVGFTHLKLMKKSLDQYGYKSTDFKKLCNRPAKYSFSFVRKDKLLSQPIKAIFFVSEENVNGIIEEKLDGIKSVQFLRRHTFGYKFIKPMQNTSKYFDTYTKIAKDIPLIHIKRPVGYCNIEFSEYFHSKLKSL